MNDTGTEQDQQPSPVAPGLTAATSGWALAPETKLQPRRTTGQSYITKQLETMTKQERAAFEAKQGVDFTAQGYVGQGLVDERGDIVRGQYSSDEAYNELAALGTAAERGAFLNILAANGVYGNSRPTTTGFASSDLSAMQEIMRYANYRGVTVKVAARLMAADPNVQQWRKTQVAGGGARVRTTAREDLRSVFKSATARVLGRDLSDAELERFIQSYNAAEVRQAMGGAMAPSASTAATMAAETAAPEEAGAMKMLDYANVVDQLMKGLG